MVAADGTQQSTLGREGMLRMPPHTKFSIESFVEMLESTTLTLKGIPYTFILNVVGKRLYYSFVADEAHFSVLESQLYASYPGIDIMPDVIERPETPRPAAWANLNLKYGSYYPFLTYKDHSGSLLSELYHELTQLGGNDDFYLQVKIKPIDRDSIFFTLGRSFGLTARGVRDQFDIRRRFFSRKGSDAIRSRAVKAGQEKNREPLYEAEVTLIVASDTEPMARAHLGRFMNLYRKLESDYNEAAYRIEGGQFVPQSLLDMAPRRASVVLTGNELATLFHFPPETDTVPNLAKILAAKGEPPIGLPTLANTAPDELSPFGVTNYRQIREKFGIKRRDRARHMYVIGKSGSGKSRLLELLFKGDIEQGQGICVIDPHGDLIDNALTFVPEHRIKDVIYFNPIDEEFPISFNPIEKVEKTYRQQIATGLIEVFKKIFADQWTPRLEHVLRMSILALLDAPQASILSLLLLLTDRTYRQEVIKTIEDQVVKNFWTNEFAGWSEKFDAEAITPILNKIGQFVSNPIIRNVVGQEKNGIVLSEIMDSRKILLVKLPKGILGEENTMLLGAMLVTRIYQSALARAAIPEEQRVPFYMYVDEFQNFATDAFANILSEARKYKLSVTLANQYVSQLSTLIRTTVFGNVGSMISFRTGPEDATYLEKEFAPRFVASDITNLGVQEIYVKLSIDDQVRDPFSARTLNSEYPVTNYVDQIIAYTREHYCSPRAAVEQQIGREKSKEMEVVNKLKEQDFSAPIV